MDRITAFLIVRDEERMLPRCLDSLVGVADELAILDTGSVDGTPALIEKEAAAGRFERVRWERHAWRGFGTARRASLALVETEWALLLDADEALSPELRDSLLALRAGGGLGEHDGYWFNRANRVLGHRMKGCKLADNPGLRLFRTGRVHFTEAKVHEGIYLDEGCTTAHLAGPLDHEAMVSWRDYLKKVDRYTSLDVAQSDRGFNPLHMLATGPLVFIKQYVFRRGLLDGWPGFVWSLTSAWSVTLRDWKRWQKSRGKDFQT